MSDSFATAPRLDSTTLTLRIYPKPPTTHTVLRVHSLSLSTLSFSPSSHPLTAAAAATRARSRTSTNQPTNHPTPCCLRRRCSPVPPVRLPGCGACFPIPHSTLVVARTSREKVTSRSRVSQDPANPSWYKIAPSGSQRRRRWNAGRPVSRENERRREIGIPRIGLTRYIPPMRKETLHRYNAGTLRRGEMCG